MQAKHGQHDTTISLLWETEEKSSSRQLVAMTSIVRNLVKDSEAHIEYKCRY